MFHSDASITKDGTEMATITKQNFVATLGHNFLRLLHVVDLWTETLHSVERLGPIEEFNQLVWTLGWAHLPLSHLIEGNWLGQIGCQFKFRMLWTSLFCTGFDPMIIHFSVGINDLSTMHLHVYWYEHPNWCLFIPGFEPGTLSLRASVLPICWRCSIQSYRQFEPVTSHLAGCHSKPSSYGNGHGILLGN